MDVDLEVIPEEEPEEEAPYEGPEEDPGIGPKDAPKGEPEYDPEYDLEFVPEDESDEEPVEEQRDNVPAESGIDEFGPVRGFDVPFGGVRDWDPSAIPPPNREMTSLETSLAQSGLQPAPAAPKHAAPEPSGAEHDLDPEESQAGYDPMDVDLEVIPEEEPEEEAPYEEPKKDPEMRPEDAPEGEPEYEPEYYPEFMPKDKSDEEPVKEQQDEVPAKSGDINNLIEIEAELESSKEQTVQGDSDSNVEESDSVWTPSKGRRG
ncbi:uncharacterized protein LOC115679362 [Syzygium oleosum]|uniref:uncharacterized protein LOC115679362 n=1 Tax=Syzygium oleosum TaxID=219896 RepID=UPI0011D1CA90|nr:uncharacterized protein LOC115679362 [Syzygium oleosum]